MSDRPTPETDHCISERRRIHNINGFVQVLELVNANLARKLERERDEVREAFIEARKHREQLNSLLASHDACWDEIATALGHQEQGDQRCDLDRVLDAIRERDEARERASKLAGQLLAEMEAQP